MIEKERWLESKYQFASINLLWYIPSVTSPHG
jgi:hypothetical protein